jgi:Fe/S biogenesis protein NfuA
MIKVTDAARDKFLEITEAEDRKGHGLRVIVHGGGGYQPQFALNFVAPEEVREDDTVTDAGDLKLYTDPESTKFLDGASVDFVETPMGAGFKIDAPNAGLPEPTGPLADKIRKVLDEKVNPGVAGHGGHIALAALEGDTAYLLLGGGCQGCGQANVTLKEGVEKILLQEIPELKHVADVTDHAAGANPYYE